MCVKKPDPCTHKLFSQFNVKMLTENILNPLLSLQQMPKLASVCRDMCKPGDEMPSLQGGPKNWHTFQVRQYT